ncbi:MAG: hypothetical protein U0L97_04180 [Candidatus Saccharimonadaceae bacterium]|nr:hypothetical protein [Candidatus Saccharimonadaceae bacterium]
MNNVVSLNNIIKGAYMKIRNESINKNYLTSSIIFTLGIATVFGIGIYNATNIANTSNANALSYSTSEDISFTFAPTLSIGLSTDNLTIDNLVPGTTSDSNAVTVTVASNTPYGYVLSAGVGSTESTDPYYNTSDLVHDNTTTTVPTTNKFSSIATSASLQTLDTDNTWGYSTSTDGGTSWSTYSGLSHTTTKPLLDISDPATPSTIDFKIAARSASTQASGTYNNVITFYAVGKPETFYMQEPEAIKSKLKNTGDTLQAIDQRDGKEYWVAKLADGNIWMTQNLDLDIEAGRTYTSADTDLANSTIGTTWTPTVSTSTTSSWTGSDTAPSSYDPGNLYWNGNVTTSSGNLSNRTTTDPSATSGGTHYHVGNYYNWTAAVAMNDSSSYTTNQQDVNQSICPAGWRLPTYSGDKSYENLVNMQGLTAGTSGNIQNAPTYFVYSGFWNGGSMEVGFAGHFRSSVFIYNVGSSCFNFFASGNLSPQYNNNRVVGFSVRCVAR